MKQFLCVVLCLCCVMAMAGCGDEGNAVQSQIGEVSAPSSTSVVSTPSQTGGADGENKELTNQGCPPLAEEIQILYQGAEEMARAFTLCAFSCDTTNSVTLGGMDYYPITDSRFSTYSKLQAHLEKYFTTEYIETNLLTPEGCVQKAEDDVAVMVAASGAEDITYAGHSFQVSQVTDTEIVFTARVYYADEPVSGGYFYTTPANEADYGSNDYTFRLEHTQNGWRFAQFSFLRG